MLNHVHESLNILEVLELKKIFKEINEIIFKFIKKNNNLICLEELFRTLELDNLSILRSLGAYFELKQFASLSFLNNLFLYEKV